MDYNFDQIIPRRGTDSYKWDTMDEGVLPLWVADMDFETAPCVRQAVCRRAQHGIYGYVSVSDSYYEAVISWFRRRHGWAMERPWILPTTGVVPALSAIVQALTHEGDKVLLLTPVYNCFFSSVRNSGCQTVECPLRYDPHAAHTYTIDFDDFERKAADPAVRLFILCNPHNPAGRAWTRDELTRLGDICLRHGVFVVSDEIHCELILPPHEYTPFASLSPDFLLHSATCTSPSKAFNTAGLKIANITLADPRLRDAVWRQININETCDVNPFGPVALQAAYSPEGEAWLDALLLYLRANYEFLREFFERHLPELPVARLEATYLVWVDCRSLGLDATPLCERLLAEERVYFNAGRMYGDDRFLRINIALPRQLLAQALERFERCVGRLS